jgi:hypothetical protein
MKHDFAKLKEVLATSPDAQSTLKIFRDTGVVTSAEALELEKELQLIEDSNLTANLSLNEIIAALEEEECTDIAERLHQVLLEK